MSEDKETLIAMGFAPERADWALRVKKGQGVQAAMDFLLAHADDPVPDPEDEMEEDIPAGAEAKSLKCSDCGKVFRSQATASFHAEKSGHENFEESTEEPLTEEEKKAKLAELREKLAAKRAAQSKEDEKAARANEAIRRKAGQDMGRVREDMAVKEAQRDAERKRQEKLEDQRARAAIKAQIEADKRERAEKAAREKALRDAAAKGESVDTPAAVPKPTASLGGGKSSEAPQTRLQIRLHVGGQPLVKTFDSNAPLREVAEFVASENLAYSVDTVKFATTFPRKQFSAQEMGKSLMANGLTPSAVLMASV
ncbi:DNA-binding protein [Trichosporon asahii var. asahii CBS 8904]|uniref:DNA-binding protein n=1 Tax=Trichosporon asahii var. asahii (strain CBS 8904) TaxID=1220162 RepID=K1V520_TRIAC|nr:DNA-binding protein [Trichosporon asahii var. asahii CBS 8904]